jgi:hypothetical protein
VDISADRFARRLEASAPPANLKTVRRYLTAGEGEYASDHAFIGVRTGDIFALAKEFVDMPPDEIKILLDSPIHIMRVGALSIMGKQFVK